MDEKSDNIEEIYDRVREMVRQRKLSPYSFIIEDPIPRIGRELTEEERVTADKVIAQLVELSKQYKVDIRLK